MNRDPDYYLDPPDEAEGGVTYIECLLLRRLDAHARAKAIGRALVTPCDAATDGLSGIQLLHFWRHLLVDLLHKAECTVGPDGREAIVQTLRNIPASRALIEH
jgi:hypothetical protein